jgi:hypothetical protein
VAVIAGLLVDLFLHYRTSARSELVLAPVVPTLVAGLGFWLTMGSLQALSLYFKGALELSRGYNLAMSFRGPTLELIAIAEALVLLAAAVGILAIRNRRMALILVLLLGLPVLVSIKHGIVRQPLHAPYAFSFVLLAASFVSLSTSLNQSSTVKRLGIITLLLAVLCQDYAIAPIPKIALRALTAFDVPSRVWNSLRPRHLRQTLNSESRTNFSSADSEIEPEIRAIVQNQTIASLSESYSGVFFGNLNLQLYPVLQRYSAYTPYLDGLEANWIQQQGPQFLLFDGKAIDGRHPWTETPAMWLEVLRWYDTRFLGKHNLLLERRKEARFRRLQSVDNSPLRFGEPMRIPNSPGPLLWAMHCSLSSSGKLRALLFRVLDVTMSLDEGGGQSQQFRVLPEVLGAPSPGNHLPSTLPEFAEVLSASQNYDFWIKQFTFGGPGSSAYKPVCNVEMLQPAD